MVSPTDLEVGPLILGTQRYPLLGKRPFRRESHTAEQVYGLPITPTHSYPFSILFNVDRHFTFRQINWTT